MFRLTTRKTSAYRLALMSAAVLLNAAPAFAAAIGDDAQAQARALLSGAPAHADSTSLSSPAAPETTVAAEDQARWLLAGKPAPRAGDSQAPESAGGASAVTSTQKDLLVGAQESARRMILGPGL